jgi:RNA polymerase sigma-70 factor (ECF subfamily)
MDVETAYRRYYVLLREKCRRMLRDVAKADDVAQETFVRLWKSGLSGDEPRQVTAWLYRTSTRIAIDHIRAQRSRERVAQPSEDETAQDLASLASPADDVLAARQRLLRLSAVLPADELEMALLWQVDGLTQKEIAEVAQVSERTVRRSLQRFEERMSRLGRAS